MPQILVKPLFVGLAWHFWFGGVGRKERSCVDWLHRDSQTKTKSFIFRIAWHACCFFLREGLGEMNTGRKATVVYHSRAVNLCPFRGIGFTSFLSFFQILPTGKRKQEICTDFRQRETYTSKSTFARCFPGVHQGGGILYALWKGFWVLITRLFSLSNGESSCFGQDLTSEMVNAKTWAFWPVYLLKKCSSGRKHLVWRKPGLNFHCCFIRRKIYSVKPSSVTVVALCITEAWPNLRSGHTN